MLYIFYGTNTDLSREKANELIKRLRGNEGGFFERVTADTFDENALVARVEESGLFSGDIVTVLDGTLVVPGAEEVIERMIKDLTLSPNAFILVEQKLSKKFLPRLKK